MALEKSQQDAAKLMDEVVKELNHSLSSPAKKKSGKNSTQFGPTALTQEGVESEFKLAVSAIKCERDTFSFQFTYTSTKNTQPVDLGMVTYTKISPGPNYLGLSNNRDLFFLLRDPVIIGTCSALTIERRNFGIRILSQPYFYTHKYKYGKVSRTTDSSVLIEWVKNAAAAERLRVILQGRQFAACKEKAQQSSLLTPQENLIFKIGEVFQNLVGENGLWGEFGQDNADRYYDALADLLNSTSQENLNKVSKLADALFQEWAAEMRMTVIVLLCCMLLMVGAFLPILLMIPAEVASAAVLLWFSGAGLILALGGVSSCFIGPLSEAMKLHDVKTAAEKVLNQKPASLLSLFFSKPKSEEGVQVVSPLLEPAANQFV